MFTYFSCDGNRSPVAVVSTILKIGGNVQYIQMGMKDDIQQ